MEVRGYILAILFLLYLVCGSATAQQYRTNLELIESIKDISLSSDIYSDTANVKNLAVLFLSSVEGDTKDANYNKFADSIMKFLTEFNTIFQESRDVQPPDHEEGVKKVLNLRDEVVYLESLSKTSDKIDTSIVVTIVNKEKDSINRFLEEQAKYFEDVAEKEEAVPLKIEYLSYASTGYRESGNPRYESIEKKYVEMEVIFQKDVDLALSFSRNAEELISDLKNDPGGLYHLFSGYLRSKNAVRSYSSAIELYHNNGISERTLQKLPGSYVKTYRELAEGKKETEELSSSIFNRFVTSLMKIVAPLVLLLVIFISGLTEWKKDFADTKLNTIVVRTI
jgi:hypothetical protein